MGNLSSKWLWSQYDWSHDQNPAEINCEIYINLFSTIRSLNFSWRYWWYWYWLLINSNFANRFIPCDRLFKFYRHQEMSTIYFLISPSVPLCNSNGISHAHNVCMCTKNMAIKSMEFHEKLTWADRLKDKPPNNLAANILLNWDT